MAIHIELKGGIIYVIQNGNQTYEAIIAAGAQIAQLTRDTNHVKILIDYRGIGKLNLGARHAIIELGRSLKYDRIAAFGAPPYLGGFLNLAARSIGKKNKMFIAQSEEEALKWLTM